MAMHAADRSDEQKRECFLCTLDPKHVCNEAELSGHIVAAQERLINGTRKPCLILDTGTTHIEVLLDEGHYRNFIRELKARGDIIGTYRLLLRLYHLPTAPETIEYGDKTRLRYNTNTYTLAVLEPDILLNITDLNQADYCARQYLLNRLIPSSTSPATLRGNLVHHSFKELLKEHDRGTLHSRNATDEQIPGTATQRTLTVLQEHLEEALDLNSVEMALNSIPRDAIRADVAPHLESLADWFESERNTLWDMPGNYTNPQTDDDEQFSGNQVRAETFLLAPEIGLRGRLDLFWQQAGRQRLLELKTGGAKGELPKRAHRWQVYGYHALLTVRRNSQMKKALATLLYSGTPHRAQAFGIPASIREIQRVNETRSILVLSRITSIPPAPPGPSRCTRCSMLQQCQEVSELLDWQPPEPDQPSPAAVQTAETGVTTGTPPIYAQQPARTAQRIFDAEDRAFFASYYHLLHLEGRAGDQQQARLWQTAVSERLEQGMGISGLMPQGPAVVEHDGWVQTFRCINTSELREGDEILLSSGSPITGEVVTGTITNISSEHVTVWTRELIAHPVLIDRYDNDLVHIRTLQNLLRWQHTAQHLRDLVAGKIRPRFLDEHTTQRPDFNSEQNLAVERARQMQDYLLIQGPPGTGKTSVIAEIVRSQVQQGQRVLLAAFTNQAVDNMLKRLDKEGFHDYLRLGSERSVDAAIRPRLLSALLEPTTPEQAGGQEDTQGERVYDILYNTPVVASTTATWSSDKYMPHPTHGAADPLESNAFFFDVAIIDEAGQLTVPAILGALRFCKRFILVGDEKQLPPLVLSKEAAEAGLSRSLFSILKQKDEDYTQGHSLALSACVSLRVQYRMNKWIANFASTVFYDKLLVAHKSVANRRLSYRLAGPVSSNEEQSITTALNPALPLVFLNVQRGEKTSAGDAGRNVKVSNREALAVRMLVAGLLARGIEPHEIGIIALYRAQVANIRRYLFTADPEQHWQALPNGTPLNVDTVDRFQGGERSVIILSFATEREPALASAGRDFVTNPFRLNVALTRAQRKLILVGNATVLAQLPTISRLITYCQSMHTLLHQPDQPPS